MKLLEIAVFNDKSVFSATEGGADRVEVCKNYNMWGYTPSYETAENYIEAGGIDVFVMIRQKANNFVFTNEDIDKMIKETNKFREMKADGFVFGVLDKYKRVHKEYSRLIIEAANPLPVTFHRAFDLCDDLSKATEDIIGCGFKRILTSGGKINAYEGRYVLRDLIRKYGNEIIFIPGGGIRRGNIVEIARTTKAKEFHTSGILKLYKNMEPEINVNEVKEIKNNIKGNEF